MTSRDFAYWVQGFFEISEAKILNEAQVEQVKKHLNLVFKHEIDPSMGGQEHQNELNLIHNKPQFVKSSDKIWPRQEDTLIRC